MKTHIIKAFFGILAFVATVSNGAENGKEQLGKINSKQYVVTQEVDSVFSDWLRGTNFSFNSESSPSGTFKINPEGGLRGFWIGDKTLYEFFQEEDDPVFYEFKNQ